MCSICGYISLSDTKFVGSSIINSMNSVMSHRGKDNTGNYFKDTICLGHNRLSVLDLSYHGNQPMSDGAQTVVISYNGEIYNFKEIRNELKDKYDFKSRTDTEVIIYAYKEWGIDCIKKFNGMFAFALYDIKNKKFYLVRDRYGIKPLYYTIVDDVLVFGSEIKAILKYPDYKKEINLDAVNQYFTFQNILTDETMFKDIYLLKPGHYIYIDSNNRYNEIKYWDFNFKCPDYPVNFKEAREQTLFLVRKAVKRQLVSDVPVGSYLSGGLDSGSICAISKGFIEPLNTFSCGFDLSRVNDFEKDLDERHSAEQIASLIKFNHYEYLINSNNIKHSLHDVIYHLEDLRLSFCYPNYYISQLASKFVKVCLSGAGGDELFGGYPWRYASFAESSTHDIFIKKYYKFWDRLKVDRNKFFIDNDNDYNTFDLFKENIDSYDYSKSNYMSSAFHFEARNYLHGFLMVGDKMSMAHTLEERFPFLDNDLVDYAQQLPLLYKVNGQDSGKYILRKAMENILPENIVNDKKKGFIPPEETWFRKNNYEWLRDKLLVTNKRFRNYVDTDYVNNILVEHSQGTNHRLLLWSLLSFSEWCEVFSM